MHALDWLKRSGLDIPFILVSGSVGEELAVAAIKQGASDYLMKDRLERLGPAVANALEKKRLRNEQQQAENALAERDRRFRALDRNSNDAITLVDAQGVILYDSPSAPGLLGYGPEEWVGQSALRMIHPDDLPGVLGLLKRVAGKPGERAASLFRLRHRSGTWLWIEAAASNLLEEPSVGGIVVNYRDVTERKQAEAEREALLEIMEGVASTESLNEFLELVRQSLSKILAAENLFVVLHHKDTGLFEEVFAVDQYDAPMPASKLEKSITSYVFRTGEPLLLDRGRLRGPAQAR